MIEKNTVNHPQVLSPPKKKQTWNLKKYPLGFTGEIYQPKPPICWDFQSFFNIGGVVFHVVLPFTNLALPDRVARSWIDFFRVKRWVQMRKCPEIHRWDICRGPKDFLNLPEVLDDFSKSFDSR